MVVSDEGSRQKAIAEMGKDGCRAVDPGEPLTDSPDGLPLPGSDKRYVEIAPAERPQARRPNPTAAQRTIGRAA